MAFEDLTEMFNKQFCHQTVVQWIKKAAQKVEESIEPLNETIEVLEIDELYTFYKKKNQIRVWLAVNRNKLQIVASEVGDGSGATVEKLLKKLSSCNIKIICTDGNYAYNKHINIKHVITKVETCLVETYNSILRHSLARLQRKTKSYSKSVEMLRLSVLLLVNKFNNRQRS